MKYAWKHAYDCHHGGVPRVRNDRVVGGQSNKPRGTQKESKKVRCPARLVLKCDPNDMSTIEVTYINHHDHDVQRDGDLLPRPSYVNDEIQREIGKNYSPNQILLAMQNKYSHLPTHRRERFLNARDIANLRIKHITDVSRLDSNDFLSVKKWLD